MHTFKFNFVYLHYNQNANMKNPKPTLSLLEKGLVAIYNAKPHTIESIAKLNFLLSVALGRKVDAEGYNKYYYHVVPSGFMGCDIATIPCYPVDDFFDDVVRELHKQEAKADQEYHEALHKADKLQEEWDKININLNIAETYRKQRVPKIKDVLSGKPHLKRKIEDALSELTSELSIDEFCETLQSIQSILKQLSNGRN